jgi:hypothetical protein
MESWTSTLAVSQLQHLVNNKPAKTGHLRTILSHIMPFVKQVVALKVRTFIISKVNASTDTNEVAIADHLKWSLLTTC